MNSYLRAVLVATVATMLLVSAELDFQLVPATPDCPCASTPDTRGYYCLQGTLDAVPVCVPDDAHILVIVVKTREDSFRRFSQLDRLAVSDPTARGLPANIFDNNTSLRAVVMREWPLLERVPEDAFWKLPNVTEISIFDSGLRELAEGAFRYSTALQEVSLTNNRLTTLSDKLLDNTTNLQTINLQQNPWHCDCRLDKFMRALASKGVAEVGNATCQSPASLEDVPLQDLPRRINCN